MAISWMNIAKLLAQRHQRRAHEEDEVALVTS